MSLSGSVFGGDQEGIKPASVDGWRKETPFQREDLGFKTEFRGVSDRDTHEFRPGVGRQRTFSRELLVRIDLPEPESHQRR